MSERYSDRTKRSVIFLLVLLGSLLISVDGENQMRNVFPFAGIAYCADIIYVTTTSDVADFELPQMIENLPGTDGVVSLREALIAANNEGGKKFIAFSIPLSDLGYNGKAFVIQPMEQLPALGADYITIDGITQTDFTGNTNPDGPEIVLDGNLAGESTGILIHPSNGHNIRGLVINRFRHEGIGFYGDQQTQVWPNDVKITKCYIGTDETGTIAKGNHWEGIAISGNRHMIGGPDPDDANLISGNVREIGCSGEHTIIQGNFIGTDRTGKEPLSLGAGIYLGNSMGGVVKGNLISGCVDWGIVLLDFAENNLIENNKIGTDISGENPLPNSYGIQITLGAKKNTIAGNIIAFNKANGIEVGNDSYDNRITRNSIFSNGGFGIELGNDGVTPNDPGDLDEGPNHLMNFPLIMSAKTTKGKLIVTGTIDTMRPTDVTIEIFANPISHWSGFGEGATYLGSIKPKSDGKFTANLPYVSHGTWITATATDANGSTSEFSLAVEVQ